MLVLVPSLYECRQRLLLTLSVFAVFSCSSAFCVVQANSVSDNQRVSDRELETQNTVSVLVDGESSNPAANGSAKISGSSSGNATFTAQPLSPAPKPPQDLLAPASPSESTFTQPLANELRGERIPTIQKSTSENPSQDNGSSSASDGSQAIGTMATTNPAFQNQQPDANSQFGSASQGRFNFQSPSSNGSSFGDAPRQGLPPVNSRSQFSGQSPSFSGSRPIVSPPVSDQPGAWRDVQTAGAGQVENNQSATARIQPPITRSFDNPINQPLRSAPPIQSGNAVTNSYNAQAYGQVQDRGNSVLPTTYTQPVPRPKLSTQLAKTLIARYSVDNVTDALPGQPTKLIEMVRQPISPQQRRPMVHQYWETYYDWANYVSAKQYEQWLVRLPRPSSPPEYAMLDAVRAIAANKTYAAEIQLGKSQSGLLQYMPNWQSADLLPLPSDLPLIQKYKTNYELYRSRQMMPVSLRGIDQMLPKTLELITKRAEAVRVAKVAADKTLDALSTGQSNLVWVLETGRIWRAAERDLIASVVSYNQAIGDYALSVANGYQTPEQVVAMLIAKPQAVAHSAPQFRSGQPAKFSSNGQTPSQFGNRTQPQPRLQPARPVQSPPGNSSIGDQSARINQNAGSSQGRGTSILDGFPRQNPNGAAGTAGNFNLKSNSAFNSAQGTGFDRSQNTPPQSPSVAPAAPINKSSFEDRAPAGSGSGFGPLKPAQETPAGSGDRSARSQFFPGVNR